jgi:Ca-activated chloride channel family protein
LILLALLLAATSAAYAQDEPQDAIFTADVSLVNLLVTVKDERGAPIGDLTKADFSVTDGGNPREIAVFEKRTNRPLSIALMVDASLSTAIELKFEREAASRFLKNLLADESHPDDRAAVYKFSDYVEMLSPFTRRLGQLSKALGDVHPETGTSVYDAIMLTSEALERREGRRVLVIITDGGDTTSRISFADGLKAAHDADAVIYPVIVVPIRSDAGRNTGGENALKTFAINTGGQAFIQYGVDNLDDAFDEILKNLRTQYLIGYYPPTDEEAPRDGFRRVNVEVAMEGATVLSRSGYFVPTIPVKRLYRRETKRPDKVSLQTPAKESPKRWRRVEKNEPDDDEKKKRPDGERRPPIVKPSP